MQRMLTTTERRKLPKRTQGLVSVLENRDVDIQTVPLVSETSILHISK
jgi:hypothetical protein